MAAPQTAAAFRDLMERSGLLPPEVLEAVFTADDVPDEPNAIADRFVEQHLLTTFQARQLARGKHRGFFLTDKYKLLEFIGAGGMGKVYLCEHLLLQRLVAVKLMLLTETDDKKPMASLLERFYREARAVAVLDHPNIVRMFDVDRMGANPFMVMEYVDGTNLNEIVVKYGSMKRDRVAHYISQAAAGLEHAHRAGLIHRDIKPSNILLDRGGTVKLLDLGLARFTQNTARNKDLTGRFDKDSVLGTVDYMAHEQASDSTGADIRSDIYSLGCTMYFLLSGRVPFEAGSLPEKMAKHRTQAPDSLSDLMPRLPNAFLRVLEKMMEKDPDERYQTPGEIVEDLKAWTTTPIDPPPHQEMPIVPASAYRLGLNRSCDASMSDINTPRPVTPNDPTLSFKVPAINPAISGPATVEHASLDRRGPPGSDTVEPSFIVGEFVPDPRLRRRYLLGALTGMLIVAGGILGFMVLTKETPKVTSPTEMRSRPFAGVIVPSGGSTFVNPIMQRWSALYERQTGIRIEYQAVGSGQGVQSLIDRVYRFGCTDAPLTELQLKRSRGMIHIPLVLGAVVPTYNLPGIERQLRFTGPILADIYLGKITKWNDRSIQISNPDEILPDMPILVVHRSDPSGTTYIWSEYLGKTSSEWKSKHPASLDVMWPLGIEGKGNNGVATMVSRNEGTIGYVELSYALENNLKFGQVKNRDGHFITPNLESVTASATSLRDGNDDTMASLTDAPGKTSYPIVGTAWAILDIDQTSNSAGRELVEFLRWATHDGQKYVRDLSFAPLPPEMLERIDAKLKTIRVGE